MMKKYLYRIAPVLLVLLAGCEVGPESGRGFTLPEGDASAGERLFTALQCNSCHTIEGNESIQQPQDPPFSIALGGKVTRIKTYGELVTSVINPSHKVSWRMPDHAVSQEGESQMKVYNEIMKVQQLIDLVAFLQAQYELEMYVPTMYPVYPMLR